jgi:SAM-dependent methyltransferase
METNVESETQNKNLKVERLISKLGEKDYWDELYKQELNQFSNNSELGGEVWFGEQVQSKVVNYILNNFDNKESKILDLGCGNCEFLISLCINEYYSLYGVDYSDVSLDFAKIKINNMSISPNIIKLDQADLNNPGELLKIYSDKTKFNIIHDKGTFDAFMLLESNNHLNYICNILDVSGNNTTFIITSCNNTKEELFNYFNNTKIKFVCEIEHKKFVFGGKTGQTVTTLIFKINSN